MDVYERFTGEELYGDFDAEGACRRLSEAVRLKSVSDCPDPAPFLELHSLIKRSFPRVMEEGSFETVDRSVLIRIPGSDPSLLPALFMSHLDVVPVVEGTEKDWTHDAYSGDIAGGYIWGRGTQDIKCQVFGELEAAEYLLSRGLKPARTMYFAFGQDEETFNRGSKAVSDLLMSRGVRLEFVLDEGGGGMQSGELFGAPKICVMPIDLMEKGYADLKLTVRSTGGHSSRPFGGTSLARLARAITRITEAPFPAELCPTLKQGLKTVAPYIEDPQFKALIDGIDENGQAVADVFMGTKDFFPYVTTTIAPTMISGGSSAPNVMPQNMEAVINFRIAAGHTPEEVMEHCRKAVDDDSVEMEFLQANPASAEARFDGLGYAELTKALARFYSDVVFVPFITAGGTDAHNYEQICDTCLRCSPFVSPEEEQHGAHGTNERMSVRSFIQGIRVLISMMESSCCFK